MEQNTNPFAGFGAIVRGESFVGRDIEIKRVHQRVLSNEFGNIGIVGIPKIGKSSLIDNALYKERQVLWATKKYLVVWHSMKSTDSPIKFFIKLVLGVYEDLKRNKVDESLLQYLNESLTELKRADISYIETEHYLLTFFGDITASGIRVIVCIDEFDHAKDIFKEVHYQLLRTLSYEPNHKICLVTTSRRNIYDIEYYSGGGSTLFGTFDYLYLGCFSDPETIELFSLVKEPLKIEEGDKISILEITGNHPYLLALVTYKYLSEISNGRPLNEILDDVKVDVLKYFDDIFYVLDQDGLAQKLIRFYSGILDGISQSEEEYIKKYGLFKMIAKDDFVPFSELFESYLKLKWRESPFKDTWPEAERSIRKLISDGLNHVYGASWEGSVVSDLPNIKFPPPDVDLIGTLKDQRRKEQKNFGPRASNNLVDQMLPRHYPIFIKLHWTEYYQNILGNTEAYWLDNLDFIAKVIRNPIQHSRQGLLTSDELNKGTLICHEIIDAVNAS